MKYTMMWLKVKARAWELLL